MTSRDGVENDSDQPVAGGTQKTMVWLTGEQRAMITYALREYVAAADWVEKEGNLLDAPYTTSELMALASHLETGL